MRDYMKDRMLAIVLLLIGVLFIIEASVVMYVLGLFPPAVTQTSPEVTQFMSIGWGYGMLKLLVGLIAAITSVTMLFSR